MSWYEVWLFLHITAAIVWIGGAATIQFFGILTKRAADPAKTVFFARNVSSTVLNVFLPSSLVIFLSGVGLTVNGSWDWGQPFIVFGLVLWAAVSLVAFGYLARALARPPVSWRPRGRALRSASGSAISSGCLGSCSWSCSRSFS
jgi:uncharacterized membrane protein